MQTFIGSIFLVVVGVVMFITIKGKEGRFFRLLSFLILLIGGGMLLFSCMFKVDEGESFVLTQFGRAYSSITKAGINFKVPWAETHMFPKRLKSYTEDIEARSGDGLIISVKITTRYRVDPEKIIDIYKLYAKSITDLEASLIFPALRESIRNSISSLSVKDIYMTRKDLGDKISEDAIQTLGQKHTIVDKVDLREINLPEQVENAIQMKIKEQQEAEAMEYKKEKARKEAEMKEIEANGIAKAQAIINKTLTPQYLQHEAIDAYKQLAGSENTTFVIMPTTTTGTGLPLILNAGK